MKAFLPLAVVVSLSTSILIAEPVLQWNLDGNLRDAVSGKDATKVGSPTFAPGIKGQALVFAGDSAVSMNAGKLDLTTFTVAAWVRSHENKLQGRIFEKGASNSIWLYATQGLVVGGFYDAAKVKYIDVNSADELLDGEWHFIATTFDGEHLSLYVDGKLENAVRLPKGSLPNLNNEPAVIGSKYKGFAHDNLVGAVDEVAVYSRALSAEEIEAAYRAVAGR